MLKLLWIFIVWILSGAVFAGKEPKTPVTEGTKWSYSKDIQIGRYNCKRCAKSILKAIVNKRNKEGLALISDNGAQADIYTFDYAGRLCRTCPSRRELAIKLYRSESHPNAVMHARQMAVNEIELLQGIAHPHVIRTTAAGMIYENAIERHIIILERLTMNWFEFSVRYEMDPKKITTFLLDISHALCYLKKKDIVHLDIHNGNILVFIEDGRARAKLADFGKALSIGGSGAARVEAWTPPEMRVAFEASESADIWSFGILILSSIYDLAENKSLWRTRGRKPAISRNAPKLEAIDVWLSRASNAKKTEPHLKKVILPYVRENCPENKDLIKVSRSCVRLLPESRPRACDLRKTFESMPRSRTVKILEPA